MRHPLVECHCHLRILRHFPYVGWMWAEYWRDLEYRGNRVEQLHHAPMRAVASGADSGRFGALISGTCQEGHSAPAARSTAASVLPVRPPCRITTASGSSAIRGGRLKGPESRRNNRGEHRDRIGANTAIFSITLSVVLKVLPYPEPSRLVLVRKRFPNASDPLFARMRAARANYLE